MVGKQANSSATHPGNGARGHVRTPSGASVCAMQAWTNFAGAASVARAAGDESGVARAFATTLVSATGASAAMVAWRRFGTDARDRMSPSASAAFAPSEGAVDAVANASAERIRAVARSTSVVAEGLPESVVEMLASVPIDACAFASVEEVIARPLAECVALEGQLVLAPLAALGIASVATVPIRRHDGAWMGAARVFFREPASELDVDRPLLGHFARQVACAFDGIALERALVETEGRLDAAFDASAEALIGVGADGRVVRTNAAAERWFGHPHGGLDGMPASMLVSPRHLDALGASLREAEAHRRDETRPAVAPREFEVVRADGGLIAVEVSVRAVAGGGAMLALRDMRERHAAEERARESDRLAAMGTLAAGLGHDMNNVLFPIRAHVNALSAAGGRMPAAKRAMHVAEIRHSVAYLQQLADSLHFLSMDPDGDGDGSPSTDLASWWSGCGALLVQSLRRKAKMTVDLAEGLPPVEIAPHALTRAMLNLLVNAAEAMPSERAPDASRVVLRARAGASGTTVIVELEDNGAGMTEEVRRQAIDMFFTTKSRGLGTGLGLPLVRRVVERAGGRLEIDSRPGMGTTTRLVLRAVDLSDGDAPQAVARVDLADGRVRALVAALVETKGCAIAGCDAGESVEDATLWIVDGARLDDDAFRAWCARREPTRIIAFGDPAAPDAAGAVGRVALPVDLADVTRAIDRALAGDARAASEKASVEALVEALVEASLEASVEATVKSPVKEPVKAPVKAAVKEPVKSPAEASVAEGGSES
ncbi:MAG: hypothetical protein RI967_2215 [Planctomycetota bacterium]